MEKSLFTVKGCKNLANALGLSEGRGISQATPDVAQSLIFFLVSSEGPPNSVASYDKIRRCERPMQN
jgi:hypothetical protein